MIRRCFVFALLRSVIGLENWRHSLNQSDAKLKKHELIAGVSRALGNLLVLLVVLIEGGFFPT